LKIKKIMTFIKNKLSKFSNIPILNSEEIKKLERKIQDEDLKRKIFNDYQKLKMEYKNDEQKWQKIKLEFKKILNYVQAINSFRKNRYDLILYGGNLENSSTLNNNKNLVKKYKRLLKIYEKKKLGSKNIDIEFLMSEYKKFKKKRETKWSKIKNATLSLLNFIEIIDQYKYNSNYWDNIIYP